MRLDLGPSIKVVSDEDKAGDRQAPGEPHEETVELVREKQTEMNALSVTTIIRTRREK